MAQIVHVDIHGQRYGVRSELDPQYISEIAAFLDERMRKAACELASADPLRIAVIAALNIADELHRARMDSRGIEGRLHAKALEIERMVDTVLDGRSAARLAINE
jgi:cell division protein ZapA